MCILVDGMDVKEDIKLNSSIQRYIHPSADLKKASRHHEAGNISLRLLHCTMLPLSTKSCLKSSKLKPILNGQFCHDISKNIVLNGLRARAQQPREILDCDSQTLIWPF